MLTLLYCYISYVKLVSSVGHYNKECLSVLYRTWGLLTVIIIFEKNYSKTFFFYRWYILHYKYIKRIIIFSFRFFWLMFHEFSYCWLYTCMSWIVLLTVWKLFIFVTRVCLLWFSCTEFPHPLKILLFRRHLCCFIIISLNN